MVQPIQDSAAINFSKGFYDAIFSGRNYADAFRFGCNNIDLNNIPSSHTPTIKIRHKDSSTQEPVTNNTYKLVIGTAVLGLSAGLVGLIQLAFGNAGLITNVLLAFGSVTLWVCCAYIYYPSSRIFVFGVTPLFVLVIVTVVVATSSSQLPNIDYPSGYFKYTGTSTWSSLRCQNKKYGIDTAINALVNYNRSFYPQYSLPENIDPKLKGKPPNSLLGIQLLIDYDNVAFTVSSLPLKEALTTEQEKKAREKGFTLKEERVAQDITTIVVHHNLNLDIYAGLSINELKEIYTSNEPISWQKFRGPNVPDIKIVPFINKAEIDAEEKGKAYPFQTYVLSRKKFGSVAKLNVVKTTQEGIEKVSKNPGGIYLAPAALVYSQKSPNVKPMPILGTGNNYVTPFEVSFDPKKICASNGEENSPAQVNSEYPEELQHEIVYVIRKKYSANPTNNDQKKQFQERAGLAYAKVLKTDKGRKLLTRMGFQPLPKNLFLTWY